MDKPNSLRIFTFFAPRALVCAALLVGCGGTDPGLDAGPARDGSLPPDASPILDASLILDAAPWDATAPTRDSGPAPEPDAGAPDAAEMLECSNESRWGLGGDDWCPNALGMLPRGSSEADCPAATAGWVANHLALGPTTVYCVYESDPLMRLPDFCTLPRSPTGAPPWTWLSPDCVSVGAP